MCSNTLLLPPKHPQNLDFLNYFLALIISYRLGASLFLARVITSAMLLGFIFFECFYSLRRHISIPLRAILDRQLNDI